MGLGYAWLTKPLGLNDPNGQISTCNLEGIPRYICPTTGGDPWKCLDCRGIRTCTAGQRAMALLDEATRAEMAEQPEMTGQTEEKRLPGQRRWTEEQKKAAAEAQINRGRARCAEALQSGDPAAYIVGTLGLKAGSVKTTLARWKKNYPDLFEDEAAEEMESVETVESAKPQKSLPAPEDGDLISLEAFLKQYLEPECEPEQKKLLPKQEKMEPEPQRNPNRELAELMIRESELLLKIAGMQEEIWEIRKRRKSIEKMQSH